MQEGHRPPNRLCDYFVSVSWLPDGSDADQLVPTLTDRFPLVDWADYELPAAASLMSMPQGLEVKPAPAPRPEVFHFMMASETGARIYGACVQFWEPVTKDQLASLGDCQEIASRKQLYMPRALTLLSHWGFLATFQQVLTELYRVSLSVSSTPLEALVRHIVLEVPLPPPGSISVVFQLGGLRLNLERPAINELPLCQVECSILFHCLDMDSVLQLFTFVLSEARIMLTSCRYALLAAFGEALRAVLFPLHWQHAYIPVLPRSLHDFAQSPCPYIMGMHTDHLDMTQLPPDVVVVNLDSGAMEMTTDPEDPSLASPIPPPLPRKETEALKDRLKDLGFKPREVLPMPNEFGMALLHAPRVGAAPSSPGSSPCLSPTRSQPEPDTLRDSPKSDGVRQAFLQLLVSILANYRDCISDAVVAEEEGGVRRESMTEEAPMLFDTQRFIKAAPDKSQPFLHWFSNTIGFLRFVEDAAVASRSDWELRYFDSMIEAFKSSSSLMPWKRKQVPFLQQNAASREVYSVPPVQPDQACKYEYDVFPTLEVALLRQPVQQSDPLMTEIAPLPRRIAPARASTGELDFVLEELVMAKMSLSTVLRRRDILWQDLRAMTAQIEKLDLQKAVLEEQCDSLQHHTEHPEPSLKSKKQLLSPLKTTNLAPNLNQHAPGCSPPSGTLPSPLHTRGAKGTTDKLSMNELDWLPEEGARARAESSPIRAAEGEATVSPEADTQPRRKSLSVPKERPRRMSIAESLGVDSPETTPKSSLNASQARSLRNAIQEAFAKQSQSRLPTTPTGSFRDALRDSAEALRDSDSLTENAWASSMGPFDIGSTPFSANSTANSTPMVSPDCSMDRASQEAFRSAVKHRAAITPRSSIKLGSAREDELMKLQLENAALRQRVKELEATAGKTTPESAITSPLSSCSAYGDVVSPNSSFASGSMQWNANV